jgi:hypothetical protein
MGSGTGAGHDGRRLPPPGVPFRSLRHRACRPQNAPGQVHQLQQASTPVQRLQVGELLPEPLPPQLLEPGDFLLVGDGQRRYGGSGSMADRLRGVSADLPRSAGKGKRECGPETLATLACQSVAIHSGVRLPGSNRAGASKYKMKRCVRGDTPRPRTARNSPELSPSGTMLGIITCRLAATSASPT